MHRGISEEASGAACISTISPHRPPPDTCHPPHPLPSHRINITVTALWVATPFLSTVSVAAVCVAVSTNQWLLTQESIKNDNYTGRGENEYFPKNTVSGLWTLCYTNLLFTHCECYRSQSARLIVRGSEGFVSMVLGMGTGTRVNMSSEKGIRKNLKELNEGLERIMGSDKLLMIFKAGKQSFLCSNIEYFPKEEYSPDLKDSTMAIPYTVTKSAAFFILSTFLLFVGEFCCLFGHFSRQRRLFIFISGVVFIISGLLMLIGLVMYISIFKAEVGGKLRPTSQLQPAVFTYKYGYSFILYVAGFVSTEISGTCAVFLYIYWHQKEWRRKGYELREKFALEIDPDVYSICSQHPYNLSSDSIPDRLTPIRQRRVYLDRHSDSLSEDDRPPTCLKHSVSCSVFVDFPIDFVPKKQNRLVGTDDMVEDCLPHPSELCHHHFVTTYPCEFLRYNCYPKDAATNTVWQIEEELDECSSTLHDHEFEPFELDEGPTVMPPNERFENLENGIRRDEIVLEALSRTTPV